MEKSTPLWCEDCRFVSFETGLGKPMLTLNDPNGFKNSRNVYSIHLELRMALPCQISTGKWKYVNPCLDFLGIPDQRTAYVKRQARPRWTYVRRSSVTPDLVTRLASMTKLHSFGYSNETICRYYDKIVIWRWLYINSAITTCYVTGAEQCVIQTALSSR